MSVCAYACFYVYTCNCSFMCSVPTLLLLCDTIITDTSYTAHVSYYRRNSL